MNIRNPKNIAKEGVHSAL